jgi:type I restriction enzyme, S subunit
VTPLSADDSRPPQVPFQELLDEPLRNGIYKPKAFHGRGTKIINMGDLFAHDFLSNQEMRRVELNDRERDKCLVKDGDLLFARRSYVLEGSGKCSLVTSSNEDCTFESSLIRARLDTAKALPRFFYYLFKSPQGRALMATIATRTAVSGIKASDLARLSVPCPSLAIQHHVVSVLSAYDDLIENNRRRIALLEQMAQAIYREWFVHFRYPGHEDDELVDSPLGLIPSQWRVESLGEVCQRITDGAHHSPPSVANGYPMASVKDMNDWGFELEGCRQISKEDFDRLVAQDCRPRAGDVLIAKDGSYLKHVFVVDEERDVVLLSSIAVLRPNGRLDPNLLAQCLKDDRTKDRLRGLVSGVAVPRIVLKDFRKFGVLVPSPEDQTAWIERARPLIECCRSLVASSVTLIALRDLLLPRLVTGAIDVSKLDLDALVEESAA